MVFPAWPTRVSFNSSVVGLTAPVAGVFQRDRDLVVHPGDDEFVRLEVELAGAVGTPTSAGSARAASAVAIGARVTCAEAETTRRESAAVASSSAGTARRAQGLGGVASPSRHGSRPRAATAAAAMLPSVGGFSVSERSRAAACVLRMFPRAAPNEWTSEPTRSLYSGPSRAPGPARDRGARRASAPTPHRAVKLYTGDEPMRETMELFRARSATGRTARGARFSEHPEPFFARGASSAPPLVDGNPRPPGEARARPGPPRDFSFPCPCARARLAQRAAPVDHAGLRPPKNIAMIDHNRRNVRLPRWGAARRPPQRPPVGAARRRRRRRNRRGDQPVGPEARLRRGRRAARASSRSKDVQ